MSKQVLTAIIAVTLLMPATVVAQPIQWEGNGHFYEFVEAPSILWPDARAAAASSQHNGITGHLLTITSSDENDFVTDTFSNGTPTHGWIGARSSETGGEWLWVEGPEAGIQFWQGEADGNTTPPFNYANWGCADPNGGGGGDDFATTALGNWDCMIPGEWGDANAPGPSAPIAGYFVEYSETDCPANIINVPADQPTIQQAIDAAADCDEIVVQPGTYNEIINLLGKAITLRSAEGADVTIIDGTDLNSSVVKCVSGEGSDTVLEGFTITGGTGSPTEFGTLGGGMLNITSSPSIEHCVFTGNSGPHSGGGMANLGGGPTVINCIFSLNTAGNGSGGGMTSEGSNLTVINCRFSANTASDFGGGMYNQNGVPVIVLNCLFDENMAGAGGGIAYRDNDTVVTNCTFSANVANGGGGGLFDRGNSNPIVTNSILWDNSDGGGTDESAQIHVTSGTTTVNHSCVQGWTGGLGGVGNIGDDPLFADPDNGDLHISFDSPCIDVGDNSVVEPDAVDMDGEARIQNRIVDMGADEFNFCIADINGDGVVGPIDLAMLLGAWGPCPDPLASCPADIHGDGDGIVQADDLATLLANWGSCP